ncbi:hypothetical protein BDB00DRAFT_875163 [Zychaea mexicana]|uniref:uncharacterized protein n=1 Tax=Zychaea mexicana TaxID=64656 RepID=UPI0022FE4855|nr:uncharacterized protein BDB00DRAFT_875163 [Zychaea mexicana]KAI9490566.1 hypothetical protein BDB00DRAFT_875163 [Zychaea mexicana]
MSRAPYISNGHPRPPVSLAELHRRAAINKADANKYTAKQWLLSVKRLFDEGDRTRRLNDLESAYIHYLKGCDILVDIIGKHPGVNEIKSNPLYAAMSKRAPDILNSLESIKEELEKQQPIMFSNNTGGSDAMERFPPVSALDSAWPESNKEEVSPLDDLPSVPTHAPQAGRRMAMPEPSPSPPAVPDHLTRRKPSAPTTMMSSLPSTTTTASSSAPNTPPPPLPPIHGSNMLASSTSSSTAGMNGSPGSSSSNFESSAIKQLQLPPRSTFAFPPTNTVEPAVLAKWIQRIENRPSILLLDVRPQSMYKEGCIRHPWICQIEPLSLRRGVTSQKIQQSLVLNAEAEQMLFDQRNKFDLIVYYDQDTRGLDDATEPLRNLTAAIYENEFNKILQRVPMLLAGGFAAWEQVIGYRGVYSYVDPNRNQQQQQQQSKHEQQRQQPQDGKENEQPKEISRRRHWLENVVGRGPGHRERLHYTPFDWFNGKQYDNELQSMTRASGPKPPLQGIFANSISTPTAGGVELPPATMPIAPPYDNANQNQQPPTPTEESVMARYPDIKPNVSSAAAIATMPQNNSAGTSLQRRRTFIDNPFHGFTETATNNYDVPPRIPAKPTRPLPPPPPPPGQVAHPPPRTPARDAGGPLYSPHHHPRPSSAGPSAPPLPSKPESLKHAAQEHPVIDSRYARIPTENTMSQLSTVQIGKTGLKNLGNTCFMSSIIQCLSGTTPLARYLLTGMYKQHVNKSNPLGTGGVLVQSLADLIRVMWSGNYNFISPVTFRQALVRFAPQFAGTEQQDSQEFLMFLLDGLHEDVNVVLERPRPKPEDPAEEKRFELLPDWQASGIAWSKYLERNESIIVSLFQGQYRSRLTCLTCKQTSTTYNTFMSLSLPIPTKSSTSSVNLYQCLDAFVKEETLDNDDAWNCPRCKKPRRSTKSLTLSRMPVVLLIHLKRFSFEGPFRNKLETMVDCPTRNLDLSKYVPSSMIPPNTERPSFKYDLYGVSNHYGSLTGGHYTAAVRDGYQGDWHYFDDTRFSMCEENKVVTRAAYNLFYVRSTVK